MNSLPFDCLRDPEDRQLATFQAAKVLTVAATQLHLDGTILELEVWQKLMEGPPGTDLPQLYDHFIHEGRDGPHLCLIANLASINLSMFRKTFPDGRIPPWILKPLLGSVSRSLGEMHAAGVMHTGMRPWTNITHVAFPDVLLLADNRCRFNLIPQMSNRRTL